MSKDWRQVYFDKKTCQGVVINEGTGNITVQGKLKLKEDTTILYWAASPADFRSSFSGSGLPFKDPNQAFDRSPNVGAVKTQNGEFKFTVFYPNAYYIGLGSLYVPPHVHIKVCGAKNKDIYHSIKISEGIPFRTLTHPAPPTENPRTGPLFYHNMNLPIRSQEQILRDSAYPSHGIANQKVVEATMPKNFWGLRPPK